eukprot:XP_003725489.2 PREDICTED: uncharacterized protein LOC100894028 [Strongylocentrotus purpuratus]
MMTSNGSILKLFVVVFLLVIIDVGDCEHFRGGSMSWRATPNGNVEITYRLAWKADTDEGDHNCTFDRVSANTLLNGDRGGIRIQYPNVTRAIGYDRHRLDYYCTARHEAAGYPVSLDRSWVMGENKKIIAPPPDGRLDFDLLWDSCCWVHSLLNYEPPKNWDFVMSVNLSVRADTGAINHAPITTGLPVQRVNRGCANAVLNIPTYDADGDDVRCRWIDGERGECRSNCNVRRVWPISKWRLQNRELGCRLILPNPGAMEVGWYAVAIMIEDSSNGVVHSKVPFQLMLEVTGDMTCSKPVILGPSTGSCWILRVGQTFRFNVTAQTTNNATRIRQIATTSVRGMQRSPLRQVPGNPLQAYVTMSWTPEENDRGVSLFCFQPEDTTGLQGSQGCIDISVGDESAPTPSPLFSYPGDGMAVRPEGTAFEIVFDDLIARPNLISEIQILRADDHSTLVHSVKVETEPGDGLIYDYNAILFSVPDGLLHEGTNYTLSLPEGLARGFSTCEPWSKPAAWDFYIGTDSKGITRPPTDRFLPRPQCFGTFMQIFVPKTMVPFEDPNNMHFNEPTCVGQEHNGTHFVMGTHYQYCGTQIDAGRGKSIISNTIRIAPLTVLGHPSVTRHNAMAINVICEMDKDKITFVEFDADLPAVVFNRTGHGTFNFSMKMYEDETYSRKYVYTDYPLEVTLEDRLFFEAKVILDAPQTNTLPGQRIFLKSCEATPTPNPADRLYYRFIENGCALDDTVQFEHQARLKTRFSIQSFAFLGHFMSESIFVHCEIQLQDNASLRHCPLYNIPTNRRRRFADTHSLSHALFGTDGPIRVVKENGRGKSSSLIDNKNKTLSQSPLGSIYVSVSALIMCLVLVALLVSMVTVMRRLKIQNRRLGKFVGRPGISLESITER